MPPLPALDLPAFLSPSLAAMLTRAPHRLARGRRFMRRRIILAVTIAAALFERCRGAGDRTELGVTREPLPRP